MRHKVTLILLCISSVIFASNISQTTDSLLRLLQTAHSPGQKTPIYRNLADLSSDQPDFKKYLRMMYHEASETNDKSGMLNALNDIIIEEIKSLNEDSVSKYTEYVKKIASAEELEYLLPLYHMRLFDSQCYSAKREESINQELSILDTKTNQPGNIYTHTVTAYSIGSSFYFDRQYEKALPYLKKAMKLAESLPDKNGSKYAYERFISWRLALTYAQVNKNEDAIRITEHLVHLTEQDYKNNYQKQRPFYKVELYLLQYYSFIFSNTPYLTAEQEQDYWNKIQEIGKTLVNDFDKYNYYHCAKTYYSSNHTRIDLPKAIAANDSLIKYAQKLASQNLPNLYYSNSQMYEQINDFKRALQYLKASYRTKDSLSTDDMRKQLNELQVKYDLNALSNERNLLRMKNKQIQLIFLSILLVILLPISIYLYFSWKKEKRMKVELNILHSKAQESEKMKQEFINSICHEVRTPLNAIVGFSDLVMNEDIDPDTRREFPAEIQKNTALLTNLVNSMLEVASLDVSEEQLPCSATDLRDICMEAISQLPRKEGIDYKLEIPEEGIVIQTNAPYLTQVIVHLLENANKFTRKGSITLGYKTDEIQKNVIIHVTDTGCGIPEDKREEVFKRFTKLDDFTQGNGLGLYLCHLITKRLAGDIRIDTRYTGGTKMLVALPIN